PLRASARCLSVTTRAHRALHSFPTRRSSDLRLPSKAARSALGVAVDLSGPADAALVARRQQPECGRRPVEPVVGRATTPIWSIRDRKSTRLNSSHVKISYAGFCLKKKKQQPQ